jgi:hypothetical protein
MIFKKKEKIISGLYYQYFGQELVKDKLDKWSGKSSLLCIGIICVLCAKHVNLCFIYFMH